MEARINNRSIEKEQRKKLARAYFLEGLSIRGIVFGLMVDVRLDYPFPM